MYKNLIGENLRNLREVRGISLQQLSRSLSERGVSLSAEAITDIEARQQPVCDIEVIALAEVIGCTVDSLFAGTLEG